MSGWYETSQFDSTAAPAGSAASTYLSFPGNAVSASGIIPRACSSIGLVQQASGVAVLGESARFEIRADVYNLFNRTNLNIASLDANLGSVAPDGTVTPNSDFGVAGSALGSRTIQLQARFSF